MSFLPILRQALNLKSLITMPKRRVRTVSRTVVASEAAQAATPARRTSARLRSNQSNVECGKKENGEEEEEEVVEAPKKKRTKRTKTDDKPVVYDIEAVEEKTTVWKGIHTSK
jgi:hypothetical protein